MKQKLRRQARDDRRLMLFAVAAGQKKADLGGIGGRPNIHPGLSRSEVDAKSRDRDESDGSR